MGKTRGFMEFERRGPRYRPVAERRKDFKAVELSLSDEEVLQQAARCMDCGVPFCHGCGCPVSAAIPEVNDHVYHRRWKEALDILLAANPFPEFTARVCPALCEGACVLGLHQEAVSIRLIELAVIEKGYALGYIRPAPPAARRPEKIAVVGSGPAGLAAADTLNQAGCTVVVYEEESQPGGILRYGIPEFKLEKGVLDRRLKLMRDEGVVFETGVHVGKDISIRFLKGRYDAVCFCTGARRPRDLDVPGRQLKGIHFAMDYLVQQNRKLAGEALHAEEFDAAGRHVAIVGGGDTGADCLGTALRQGAARVLQLELLPAPPPARAPATPWPMWPHLLRESSSHAEGGERRWSVATQSFEGRAGRVCRLHGVAVAWEQDEESGRNVMRERPGTAFQVDADLVLLAMGFTGPVRNRVLDDLRVERDAQGVVRRNAEGMTSEPGIFVAGDMFQGASLVVRAIADGRRAGDGILRYFDARS